MSNAVRVGSNFLEHLHLKALIAIEKHLIEYLVNTILYENAWSSSIAAIHRDNKTLALINK